MLFRSQHTVQHTVQHTQQQTVQHTQQTVQHTQQQQHTVPQVTSPSPKRNQTARIDSSQMPRPPRPQKDITFNTKAGVGRKVPPLSNSIFRTVDKGNCSPRLLRITTCAVPCSEVILNNTAIPLALIVTPFSHMENNEDNVPIIDMGESPPR